MCRRLEISGTYIEILKVILFTTDAVREAEEVALNTGNGFWRIFQIRCGGGPGRRAGRRAVPTICWARSIVVQNHWSRESSCCREPKTHQRTLQLSKRGVEISTDNGDKWTRRNQMNEFYESRIDQNLELSWRY